MFHLGWFLAAAPVGNPPSLVSTLLMPMLLIFMVFYFVWWLPTRKRENMQNEFLANLKKGDKVVTTSGLYGKIVKVEDDLFVLEISENTRVRVAKRAIGGLENEPASQDGGQ
ncbi:MAG: preprotein translocase subunit YajC [Acidobacteriota bacterium]